MGLFGRKGQPRESYESVEDDGLVEINELYDSEKRFRRVNDKHAELIMEDHKKTAIRKYMRETGGIVTYDSKADRYTKWHNKWR